MAEKKRQQRKNWTQYVPAAQARNMENAAAGMCRAVAAQEKKPANAVTRGNRKGRDI